MNSGLPAGVGLPAAVAARVAAALGGPVERVVRAGGGCINQAATVSGAGQTVFVKWHVGAPAGFFAAEADGLRRLAATETVRVPRVLAVADGAPVASLVLEWIPAGRQTAAAEEDAGRRLAALHQLRGLPPGLEVDNVIGALPQRNTGPADGRWLTFFRQQRIGALAHHLPGRLRRQLEALPLERWLGEPDGGCALLHGDLWSGNLVCAADGAGWVVDPAVYAGHPEVDLAMTRLFGGFGARFYAAYDEVAGLFEPGLNERLEILNLYPLLVHVALLGGGYVAQVAAVVERFGAV